MKRVLFQFLFLLTILSISEIVLANNYALQFDGINDYVLINDNASLDLSAGITLEVWIYINTSIGKRMHIISKNEGFGGGDHAYALQTTNPAVAPPFPFVLFLGQTDASLADDATLPTFQWVHIAGASDGQTTRLYVDGILVEEKVNGGQESLSSNNLPLLLGKLNNFTQYFEGFMDEARVWRVMRTQQQIQDNMFREMSDSDILNPVLVGYWQFNEGTGSTLSDASTYNNNGQLLNNPTWVISTAPISSNIIYYVSINGNDITGDGSILNPFATIQKGINSTVDGDTVLVEKGEYVGDGNRNIDFNGKAIYLKSIQGADSTIINCEGSPSLPRRGFYLHAGEDTTTIIDGFTITNGYANDRGGAIYCSGGAVKILNCIIDMNTASATGGGIYTYSSIVVRHTIFSNNNASTTGGGFTDRFASSIIEYCLFFNNNALNAGGGLHSSSSSTMVKNCTFSKNNADLLGGGMSLNSVATPTIINSIFSFNEGSGGLECDGETVPDISCSNIYGNVGGDWNDCLLSQLSFKGNFSDDPEFCNSINNDFTLKDLSPCVSLNNSCNTYIGAFEIGCFPTGIKDFEDDILPVGYFLKQNYPNPFNPSTTIGFNLPQKTYVQLKVFNIMGQLVSTLIDKELLAGIYSIEWDGSKYASGIYMYKLKTEDFSKSNEMLLLK